MTEISVIMPVYNGMPYFPDALSTVLKQDLVDIQVIISDDASTDGTTEYLKSIEDKRVRIFHHSQNLGATQNWNFALEAVDTKYCLLLCADDLLDTNVVSTLYEVMKRFEDSVALVSCQRRVIDPNGRVLISSIGIGRLEGFQIGKNVIRGLVRSGRNLIGEPSATLFETNVARELGGFRSQFNFCPDLDMWIRILGRRDYFGIREPLVSFRVSSASGSFKMARIQRKQSQTFLHHVRESNPWVTYFDLRSGVFVSSLASWIRRFLYRQIKNR